MSTLALSLLGLAGVLVLIGLRVPIGVAMGAVAFLGFCYLRNVNVALSALSDSHRRRVLSFCDHELRGVTLIRLGRDAVLEGFWSRTLRTVERQEGPNLRSEAPTPA